MNAIATTSGPRAWLSRRLQLINVTLKLRWAEDDRELLARQCALLPLQLKQKDLDIGAMRVEQALLRDR